MTNISAATDEELSAFIAEKLEPMEQLKASGECAQTAWKSIWCKDDTGRHYWRYEPMDMVNDAKMTVMLMEKMAHPLSYYKMFERVSIQIYAFSTLEPYAPRLGRAVAEAYAKANGWSEQ